MQKTARKILTWLLILAIIISQTPPANAADADNTASVMKLQKTEGTVTVTKNGRSLKLLKEMRLYNGYTVETDASSYAWVNLDSTKLVKLDASSRSEIRKSGKKLEVLLISGNLYGDITKPLDPDENLSIRTSTAIVGVRGTQFEVRNIYAKPNSGTDGTSGGSTGADGELIARGTQVIVLSGQVQLAAAEDGVTDIAAAANVVTVSAGQIGTVVVSDTPSAPTAPGNDNEAAVPGAEAPETPTAPAAPAAETKTTVTVQTLNTDNIGGYAQAEALGGAQQREIKLPDGGSLVLTKASAEQKQRTEETAVTQAIAIAQTQEAQVQVEQEQAAAGQPVQTGQTDVKQDMVWEAPPEVSAPSESGGSDSSGSSDSSDNSGNSGSAADPETPPSGPILPDPGPGGPDTPDEPDTPDNPDTPDTPDNPDNPDNPDTPDTPDNPDNPDNPDEPDTPDNPDTPDEPDTPDNPDVPDVPDVPPIYTVTFNYNYTNSGASPETLETDADGKLTVSDIPADPTRADYAFIGWNTAPNGSGETVAPDSYIFTADTTLYAQWALLPKYAVTFNYNGTGAAPLTVATDTAGNLAAADIPADPTRSGYTFNGWYTAPSGGTEVTPGAYTFTEDTALYAHWKVVPAPPAPVTYTITFDPNGRSVSWVSWSSAVTGTDGKLTALPGPTSDKDIFWELDGWYTAAEGGTQIDLNTVFTQDTTIYAHWTELFNWTYDETTQTLTFRGDGDMPDYDSLSVPSREAPWAVHANQAKKVVIMDGITSVGDCAFYYFTNLTSVTFENSAARKARAASGGITRIGHRAFDQCWNLTDIDIPNTVVSIGDNAFQSCGLTGIDLPNVLKSIGGNAFNNCQGLVNVTIPDSVDSISEGAFFQCRGLTSVRLSNNITEISPGLFDGCENLTDISIPENVTSIGDLAFRNCSSLTGITIPDNVASIGWGVFAFCTSLTSINIPKGVSSIVKDTFYDCSSLTDIYYPGTRAKWNAITIGDGNAPLLNAKIHCSDDPTYTYDAATQTLTINGTGAMPDYDPVYDPDSSVWVNNTPWAIHEKEAKKLVITDGLTSIGDYAFYNFTSLTSVVFPDSAARTARAGSGGITRIGVGAFALCGRLTDIEIPESVAVIEANAFNLCAELTGIKIPAATTDFDGSVFSMCPKLTGIEVDPANTVFVSPDGTVYNKAMTKVIRYPSGNPAASYTLPDSVASIDDYAFSDSGNLTAVDIPDTVVSIGNSAFVNCHALTSIKIPDGVTSIGVAAFASTGLPSVTIPDGVVSISPAAFAGCRLSAVIIPASVKEIGDGAFEVTHSLTDVVYLGTRAEWENDIKIGENNDNLKDGTVAIHCADGTEEYMVWTYDARTETLKIMGRGPMPDYHYTDPSPWDEPASPARNAKTVVITGLTSIGDYAFNVRDNMTALTIPDSVTDIGDWAFYKCTGLTHITIPKNVAGIGATAFAECSGLTGVTLQSTAVSIGGYAFASCGSLTDVYYTGTPAQWAGLTIGTGNEKLTGAAIHYNSEAMTWNYDAATRTLTITGTGPMPDYSSENPVPWNAHKSTVETVVITGLTSIGTYAFSRCEKLTSVTLPDTLTRIEHAAFNNCTSLTGVTIPNGVTSIGSNAFSSTNLTSVKIPDGVTSIGYSAFWCCRKLAAVDLPASVRKIDALAFYVCENLTSIDIPSGVKTIEQETFHGCSRLADVTIPNTVTSIGQYAFYGCAALKSVTIPNSVTSIGNSAFKKSGLQSVTVPDSVTSIGNSAFSELLSLTSVKLSDKLTSISESMFYDCRSLTSVDIPDGVTSIGNGAFSCSGLTSVTIPEGVTDIGGHAFRVCRALTSVTLPDTLTSIGSQAFQSCESLAAITIPVSVTNISAYAFQNAGLTDIYYPGTRAQWAAITIGDYNDPLYTAAFHGTDGSLLRVSLGLAKVQSVLDSETVTSVTLRATADAGTLPVDAKLTVPAGKTLRIWPGVSLEITGEFEVVGTLINDGDIQFNTTVGFLGIRPTGHVTNNGTYTGPDGYPVCYYNDDGATGAAQGVTYEYNEANHLIDGDNAYQMLNSYTFRSGSTVTGIFGAINGDFNTGSDLRILQGISGLPMTIQPTDSPLTAVPAGKTLILDRLDTVIDTGAEMKVEGILDCRDSGLIINGKLTIASGGKIIRPTSITGTGTIVNDGEIIGTEVGSDITITSSGTP